MCVGFHPFKCFDTHYFENKYFVFVDFPEKATFRTCLGPFRYSKDRTTESLCNVLSSDYREELLASLWITESYSGVICQCIGNMTNMNGRPKKYKRNDLPTRGIGNWDDMKNRTKKADTIIALKTKQKKTQSWATTSVKTALGFREVQETEELSSPRAQQATALNNRQSPTVELGFRFSETSPKNGINRCARYPLLSSWFPYMMVPKVFLPPPKK